MSTYLTKSKVVHALDCSTKLYYHENEEYKSRFEDEFLQALAGGGLQVELYLMLIDKTKKATVDSLLQFFMREEKFSMIYPARIHYFMMTLCFGVKISISEFCN